MDAEKLNSEQGENAIYVYALWLACKGIRRLRWQARTMSLLQGRGRYSARWSPAGDAAQSARYGRSR